MPSRRYVVRINIPVLISPFSEIIPTAPPYHPRASFSSASTVRAAAFLGAPITVTAHMWLRNASRSEEHTSELQSGQHIVCRLLLEKKRRTHQPDSCNPANSIFTRDSACTSRK